MQVTAPYQDCEALQEIEGQNKTHGQHLAQQALMPVVDFNVTGHGPNFGILHHGGHGLEQSIFFDDAVRVDGNEDIAAALGKPGIQAGFFAAVFRELDSVNKVGITALGPADVSPGVILGAVVNTDNFKFVTWDNLSRSPHKWLFPPWPLHYKQG